MKSIAPISKPYRCAAFVAVAIVLTSWPISPRAEVIHDSLCPHVEQIIREGRLDAVAVPFGDVDIDNDGVAERVRETAGGSSGAHSIFVGDNPDVHSFTCSGCASIRTTKVQIVEVGSRNYIVESDDGMPARLWKAEKTNFGWGGTALCGFAWYFSPKAITGERTELCQGLLDRHGTRIEITPVDGPGSYDRRVAVAEDAKYIRDVAYLGKRPTEPFSVDLDNDGQPDSMIRADMIHTGGAGCAQSVVMYADGNAVPEDSARNSALITAQQKDSCDHPTFTPIRLNGRTYLEGKSLLEPYIVQSGVLPGNQGRPFWALFDLTAQGLVKQCAFDFDGRVQAIPVR